MDKIINLRLSNEEANAIDNITRACRLNWFWLVEDDDQIGFYRVEDLENDEVLQLDDALSQALDAFEVVDRNAITAEERRRIEGVLKRLAVVSESYSLFN